MRKTYLAMLLAMSAAAPASAQGWPADYKGVMLQGFYWDSFSETQWTRLESQADDLSKYFSLVWIPQSASCGGNLSMGYDDMYWMTNYNSSFGNEQQLRSMIKAFKNKGIGTIADVVINHRKNVSTWVDFPKETYKGQTYEMTSTDICADDDGGATAEWASANGFSLSSNNDTGEGWSGMRDLDHQSSNVQRCVKAYLDFLLNDLGYTGFRYDMTKGYAGRFTAMYNAAAKPQFSVGEYWDGNPNAVKNWINSTEAEGQKQSAAFDFPFRYTVRDAINNNDWTRLSGASLASDNAYKQYAVTFVENHDTQYRSLNEQNDPLRRDTLAANAFMLAMPGTPCVFLKHWIDCKRDIKNMILLRRLAGIGNQSSFTPFAQKATYYAVNTAGSNLSLIAVVGSEAASYSAPSQYCLAAEGHHYRYYVESKAETAWADLPSGTYEGNQTAVLRALSADAGARIAYTLDGSEPTTASPAVASGTRIDIPTGTKTLKAALLKDGKLSGAITREYTITDFQPFDITVNVNADEAGWQTINFYTWGGYPDGMHASAAWPGDAVSTTATADGKQWFCKSYTMNSPTDFVNFVFNLNASTQTVDVTNVNRTSYFLVTAHKDNGKYTVNDVTDTMTGIANAISTSPSAPATKVFAIDGRAVRSFGTAVSTSTATSGLTPGLYIVNGKKVAVGR